MYEKLFSLKSHDYSLDHRADELFWQFVEFAVTISTNTGTVEVSTELDEVVGIINLNMLNAALTSTNQSVKLLTDGVIATGAITVSVNTLNIGDGAITLHAFIIGKRKLIDA
jgi:hypothetical protein